MDSTQTVQIPLSELVKLNTENGIKDQRIKELEAKIAELLVSPATKPRKQAVKKELTPEEQEAQHLKRVEAGKKASAKRKENEALKKEQDRVALLEQVRAQFEAEMSFGKKPEVEELD
jgi:hypothetical protein